MYLSYENVSFPYYKETKMQWPDGKKFICQM